MTNDDSEGVKNDTTFIGKALFHDSAYQSTRERRPSKLLIQNRKNAGKLQRNIWIGKCSKKYKVVQIDFSNKER